MTGLTGNAMFDDTDGGAVSQGLGDLSSGGLWVM